MAKIPFTLEAWLADRSQRVETRDGRPARIICTDAKADDGACIIALIPGYGGEEAYQFFPDGHAFSSKSSDEDCADLFLLTLSEFEVKVSEFAEAYELAATDCESEEYKTCNGNLQLIIDKYADELLEPAKKEIEKDLPRLVKVNKGAMLDKYSKYLLCSNGEYFYCCGTTINRDGYMLLVDNLKKLPKEE